MGLKSDSRTAVERADRELVITRTFDASPRIVYKAWTTPELFMRWWAPKSSPVPMIACEMDVRTGGGYRIAYGDDPAEAVSFFGKYIEVEPDARLVWTNEEDENGAVTTVTFAEKGDKTQVVMRETFKTKEALEACYDGMEGCYPEQFDQLAGLLVDLGAGVKG